VNPHCLFYLFYQVAGHCKDKIQNEEKVRLTVLMWCSVN
jgi:hypothetical protein